MIQPFGKRILIEPIKKESAFISTSEDGMMTNESIVVAVGDKCIWAEVGDKIIANYWGRDATEMADGRKVVFIIEDEEYILCKITNAQE